MRYISVIVVAVCLCGVLGGVLVPGAVVAMVTHGSKESVSGKYLAANYAYKQQHLDAAARVLLRALEKNPNDTQLLSESYVTLLYAGQVQQAIEHAKRYRNLKPDDTNLLIDVLDALEAFKQERYVDSSALLEAMTKAMSQQTILGINKVMLPYLLVWSEMGKGAYDQATLVMDALIGDENKGAHFLYFQAGLVYDMIGNHAKAAKFYERSIANYHPPYRYIKAIGNFYERQQDIKRARELYSQYQLSQPHVTFFKDDLERLDKRQLATKPFIMTPTEGLSEMFAEAARVLYSADLRLEAMAYMHMVLYINPHHYDIIDLLGSHYELNQQYTKAVEAYQLMDKSSDYYWPSRVYIQENRYLSGEKMAACKELLALGNRKETSYLARVTLADLLRSDHHYEHAVVIYDRILKDLNVIKPSHWGLYFARGVSYERTGRWPRAEEDFLYALTLRPQQPDVLNYLGYSWIDRNVHLEQATHMLQEAVRQRPGNAQIVDSMGWALYKQQDYERAAMYTERALELLPDDAVINDHLGDIYWHQGRKNEAEFQWKRALKYPSSMISSELLQEKITHGILD